MTRSVRHILFWIAIYFIWAYMKTYGNISYNQLFINVIHVAAYASIYYVLKHWQIPHLFDKNKYFQFGLSLIASTAIIMLGWYFGIRLLSSFITIHPSTLPERLGPYALEAIQMFVPGMILLAWESYIDKEVEAEQLHKTEKEHLNNELKYLKAQVNPTFLFNTLKNLQTYVNAQSSKAPDMIMRLSGMLDYMLYKSQKEKVTLNEEVDAIKDFIALEQLRYEDKLEVDIFVEGDLSMLISPLVLLNIVERSINESVLEQDQQLKLTIEIIAIQNQLDYKIKIFQTESNLKHELKATELTSIKRQLELSYPHLHQLSSRTENNALITSLSLQTSSNG